MFGNGNGKGLSSLYDVAQGTERLVDEGLKDTVANDVIDQINRHWSFAFDAWGYCRLEPATALDPARSGVLEGG